MGATPTGKEVAATSMNLFRLAGLQAIAAERRQINVGAFFKPILILRNIGGVVFGMGLAWLGIALMVG